ncbi:hypothetical protein FRB90_000695 [Tulasnella sp. 427]|nr:hypothetical protein FRB90_000695 [Tulasnella sp. 427]
MESAARSGLLIQESGSSRMGPSGTVRAPSRTSVQHPNMQWASTEDDLAPRVNDLDVMPPPASTSWRKNPPPGAQWSTSEEGAQARAAAAAAPPNGTPKPPPVHGFISSAVAFNAEQRRRMDSPWRSSVMSNATTASSGSGSIVNSAGVLSSASSTFTRFSNGSARSVSTTATSASAMSKWGPNDKPGSGADGPSWRPKGPPMGVDSGFVGPDAPPRPRKAPMQQKSNVKRMDGIPWELNELPRVHQPRVKGVLSDMPNKKPGYAQQRGHRSSPPLDPISEKNNSTSQSPPPSPDVYRSRDGTTSTTDLDPALDAASSTASDPRPSPDLKKQGPQKTQSNAFQKFSLFKAKQRD